MLGAAVACAGQRPSDRPQALKSQVRHHQAADLPALRSARRAATRTPISFANSFSSAAASPSVRPLVVSRTTASRAARAARARLRPRAVRRTSTRRRSAPARRTASPSASSWLTSRTAPECVSPSASANRPM